MVFRFLLRFLLIYLIASLIYNLSIASFPKDSGLDPFTGFVVGQTGGLLSGLGFGVNYSWNDPKPGQLKPSYHSIYIEQEYAISVAGGCNALRLMILYSAFILSFPTSLKRKIIFLLLGIPIIHFANLMRLGGLCLLNTTGHRAHFYFYHKYAFTLLLYALIIALWFLYMRGLFKPKVAAYR